MNGSANGFSAASGKAESLHDANGSDSNLLPRIHNALQIVHSPYASNESRKEASAFLEEIKANEEAPYHGFTLASDQSQQAVVRHYALSLLEHAIKHRWPNYQSEQVETMRGWILQLAEHISQEDPLYLRNKTAQLWVEVAKRVWGTEWNNMDELLVRMWEVPKSVVHKEFVLYVLDTLSDEIFSGDDAAAALREESLKRACLDIFTPAALPTKSASNRQSLRFSDEGWLVRLGQFLMQCLDNDVQNSEQYWTCAVKTLAVLKSVMPWVTPSAITAAACVKHMSRGLAASNVPVQMASIEALHVLYARTHFTDEDYIALVCPMYTQDSVNLLRKLYEWCIVDPRDIDEEKYLLLKKFSEMISNLGNFIDQKSLVIPEDCDLPNLLNLFLEIVRNPSLVVSIPVLVTWTRLLHSEDIGASPAVIPLIGPLLETCSSRLVRYENFPDDSDDPSFIFLTEDIDTVPERHAFLGNYRRYSVSAIEYIVRWKQSDAIFHILSQAVHTLEHLYDDRPPFTVEEYSKTSMPSLKVEAQFTVVEAALKSYLKWRLPLRRAREEGKLKERETLENHFEAWCYRLLAMNFEDPLIRKRVLQIAVAFATSVLDAKPNFMLKVLEHILTSHLVVQPEFQAYTDAVKESQNDSVHELRRLATKMPNQLFDVYDQLEAKVNELIASETVDSKQKIAYQSFLFVIIQRVANIDSAARMQKLEAFIAPVKEMWKDAELTEALSSFNGFCNLLGIGKVRDYLVAHRVHDITDWSSLALDAEGQAMQTELLERVKALPLRPTKSFLGSSTEKVEKDTTPYEVSCALWHDAVPIILPNLLQFMSHAHAFSNPANWLGLPIEMRSVINRILTDRFWQAGISGGSKDDFYARVIGTKSTMEGFASTIRGSVRAVRDTCYSILYGLSRLDVHFYGFDELPGPLAHALFADAHCLSSHQLINLLNLARYLVDDCPVKLRDHFIPPLLAACFAQIDSKISSEWEKLGQRQHAPSGEDELTEEMKEESSLRQATHVAVMLIASILDPARLNPDTPDMEFKTMRAFCISSPAIFEPLILFCTHAIRFKDTRCCGVVLRIFRSIVPEFSLQNASGSASAPAIREFMSSDVLKACITSLHEPYFVDLQKELSQLIASLLLNYGSLTDTPRQVLLSLPGIDEWSVDKCLEYIGRPGMQHRQQGTFVLELLGDLKGVSISEQGRISKRAGDVRKEVSKMQKEFMKVEAQETKRQPSPSLEGVAGMFDT